MTVASSTNKAGPYAGDGVTVAFSFAFKVQASTDIEVVSTTTVAAVAVDTTLVAGTDYTVALNADQDASPGGSVTATVAPAVGAQITILRNLTLTQGASLPNQGGFYPKVIENALDKLTMMVQQLYEKTGRALLLSVADSITNLHDLLTSINNSASAAAGSASAAGASASSASGSATAAAGSATAAAASASDATTNGAAQVALATTQANLATTNGAAQVALATTQANLATTNGAAQVALAQAWATQLGTPVSGGEYSAKYWAQQAASLLTGELTYMGSWDASTAAYPPSPVKGAFWKVSVGGTVSGTSYSPGDDIIYNGTTWDKIHNGASAISLDYTSRGNLRTGTYSNGDQAIIDGLGLFIFSTGSTEIDDDETCFAATGGCWLLEAAAWDVAFAYWLPDYYVHDERIEDAENNIVAAQANIATLQAFEAKFLSATFSMTLTSLASVTSSDFTVTVTGAALGDTVIVNPGDSFGTSTTDKALLSYSAYISAANTVTVSIRNASASSANMTASTWAVRVIKQ